MAGSPQVVARLMQTSPARRTQFVGLLCVGFVLTGVGTALLSSILPTLTGLWHMSDDRAGILFAAQFSGSAAGALFVGTNFFAAVVRGYVLLILSSVFLAFGPSSCAGLSFLSFGLGLGLTMTATSMAVGVLYVDRRGSALSLLNGFWAIGAAVSPALASLWVSRWPPTHIFLLLASSFAAILAVIARLQGAYAGRVVTPPRTSPRHGNLHFITFFAALGSLYVGVEASISGWMMSYVHRQPLANVLSAPIAASVFWIALLLGRMLAPAVLRRISESQTLSSCIAIALVSSIVLLLSRSPVAIILCAGVTGLALGPIYPLLLAKALTLMKDSPDAKWVFSISGLGAAVLPWVTGKISTHNGSLRVGLLVPVVALATMMTLNRLRAFPEVQYGGHN